MRNILLIIVFGVLVGLIGCNVPNDSPAKAKVDAKSEAPAQKTANLKREDANGVFVIAVGGEITVILNENPAKKGKWFIKQSSLHLHDENKRTNSPTSQDRRFVLHAHNIGQSWLTFEYKEDNTVIETIAYFIIVK